MDEINYIFGMMRNYEHAFGVISNNFRIQRKVNLSNGFCLLLTSVGFMLTCKVLKEQDKEITNLKERIKELELMEGE